MNENRKTGTRLAFIDLDGTLLGPDRKVSAENLSAMGALSEAGVEIVVASGRHHKNITVVPELRDVSWVLSSQGAVVRHAHTGEVLRELTMQAGRVAALCERARGLDMTLMAYQRDGAFVERATPWSEVYSSKAHWVPELRDFRSLPQEGFQKILWSDSPGRIAALAGDLRDELGDDYQMVVTEPELLEFLAPGATKASGAEVLAGKLGIDRRNTFAFGDGNNDVEILRWAGVSVAMHHGWESARAAARFVSPPGPPETAFARSVELALSA